MDHLTSLWIILHHCGLSYIIVDYLASLWLILRRCGLLYIILDYYYCGLYGLLLQPLQQGMDEYRCLIQKKEDIVRLEWCSPGGQQIVCVSDICMFQRIR